MNLSVRKSLQTRIDWVKRIFRRKLDSKSHREAWQKYENTVLYYRSNSIFLFHVIHVLLNAIGGQLIFVESKEYLESDNPDFDT